MANPGVLPQTYVEFIPEFSTHILEYDREISYGWLHIITSWGNAVTRGFQLANAKYIAAIF